MLNLLERKVVSFLEGAKHLLATDSNNQPQLGKRFLYLGQARNFYQPKDVENIYLLTQERLRHIYILGATGCGKTKFIESLIRQDIVNNQGFCLIDPHGDLYQSILQFLANLMVKSNSNGNFKQIAQFISQKLVLVEPANHRWTVGFNPLETKGINPHSQISEFMGIFKRLWADAHWGPRMEELLRNTLLTLSINNLTLLEAKALLADSSFRDELCKNLPDSEVKDYWLNRFNLLSDAMQATYREPILNRMSVFLADPRVRGIVGQQKSTIDFRQIMDQGKWLLVNLSKGELKQNSNLLGSLIVAKIQLSALSRVDIPENARRPFFLYADEFQNLINDDFETILSEARKYGLGITLAHQNSSQISQGLRATILGNAATKAIFRLSNHDAQNLASELGQKEKQIVLRNLINLKIGQAYLKKSTERPRIMSTPFVKEPKVSLEAVKIVKMLSFSNCARLKIHVEDEITKRAKILNSDTVFDDKKTILADSKDSYESRFAPKGKFEEAKG